MSLRASPGNPSAPLPKVLNLQASDGDGEDSVDLTWNAVRVSSFRNYRVRYCTDINQPAWVNLEEQPTRSFVIVPGLKRLQQHWFQVRAYGVGDPGEWSDPVPATPV